MIRRSDSIRVPRPNEDRSAAAWIGGRRSRSPRMRPRPPEPRVRTISLLEEGQMAVQTSIIDENKLNAFLGQLVGELGATVNAGLIVLGDRLGLYKAMAQSGPITSAELAEKTGTSERYVREWLNAQAAGSFVTYDPATQRYELPAEHAPALGNEDRPAVVCGAG